MVREYGEMTCFQHMTEVAHGRQPGVLGHTRCISVGLGLVSGRIRLGAAKC
jgi:hypothetical protein